MYGDIYFLISEAYEHACVLESRQLLTDAADRMSVQLLSKCADQAKEDRQSEIFDLSKTPSRLNSHKNLDFGIDNDELPERKTMRIAEAGEKFCGYPLFCKDLLQRNRNDDTFRDMVEDDKMNKMNIDDDSGKFLQEPIYFVTYILVNFPDGLLKSLC